MVTSKGANKARAENDTWGFLGFLDDGVLYFKGFHECLPLFLASPLPTYSRLDLVFKKEHCSIEYDIGFKTKQNKKNRYPYSIFNKVGK